MDIKLQNTCELPSHYNPDTDFVIKMHFDEITWDVDAEDDWDDEEEDIEFPEVQFELPTSNFDYYIVFDKKGWFYEHRDELTDLDFEEEILNALTEEFGYCIESFTADPPEVVIP